MTDILLTIDNVVCRYGAKEVLSGVTASINKAHPVVSFLGPSGCGKTTILRILAGLQKPTKGNVILGDGSPVRPGVVGMVFQNYILYRNRTVLGNLAIAAQQSHTPKPRMVDVMTKFGIYDLRDSYPSQLSGGQRQRVAIAQQILCSSHYLLLDEPTTGLDPLSKRQVCQLVHDVAHAANEINTVILVTHDIRAAIAVSDVIFLLGRDRDEKGKAVSGTKVLRFWEMDKYGLSWGPGVQQQPEFQDLEKEVLWAFEAA